MAWSKRETMGGSRNLSQGGAERAGARVKGGNHLN